MKVLSISELSPEQLQKIFLDILNGIAAMSKEERNNLLERLQSEVNYFPQFQPIIEYIIQLNEGG